MTRRRWSEQQMRELLHEHQQSGLSLKAFHAASEDRADGIVTTPVTT